MADRIKFCRPDGREHKANSGAPPVLVAFGLNDASKLKRAGIPGTFTDKWRIIAPKAKPQTAPLFGMEVA
jgi:hypothetical protein